MYTLNDKTISKYLSKVDFSIIAIYSTAGPIKPEITKPIKHKVKKKGKIIQAKSNALTRFQTLAKIGDL
jgi:hypothetical protein